jgi:hypothetical protein
MNTNYSKELVELINIRELKNYIKNNFNIDTTICVPVKYDNIIKIDNIYSKLLFIIVTLIIYVYILYKIIKYHKKYVFIVNLILFIILLFLLLYLIKNIYSIYLYYNLYKKNLDNCIDIKNIVLDTGDIIQEFNTWHKDMAIFTNLLNIKKPFFHTGMIIKFKNRIYCIHIMPYKINYPFYILKFNNCDYIEICPLDNYFKYNYYNNRYYRLIKNTNKNLINNYNLFNALNKMNIENMIFSIKDINIDNDYNNNVYIYCNCVNFIYKLLYKLDIIPLFNFQHILPNDIVLLYSLSNNVYQKEKIIKINENYSNDIIY